MLAALYISSNNVGVNKIPTSNVQLDINGTFNINNSMTFVESMSGVANHPSYFINSNNTFYLYHNGVQRIRFTDQAGINVSDKIYSTSDMFAPAFNVLSDSNLKRDIIISDANNDREKINNINVYDYRFYNNTSNIKGFIAQQVEEIFPQAIQRTMGVIPSSAVTVFLSRDGIISLEALPFTVEVGERLTATSSGRPCEFMVYKIDGSNIHVSGDKQFMGMNITVTGKFGFIRTIDTNQLLALCFSSLKDCMKNIEVLNKKIEEIIGEAPSH
jgi:Chaperone of endosialidase